MTILNAMALVEAWRAGARFDSTVTLGRMDCFIDIRDLLRLARLLPRNTAFVESVGNGQVPQRMDDFFRALGAKSVDAVDASDFEGATIIQDLNAPLAAHLHSHFDAVIDGGTLEHVFNLPMAFKNTM